MAALAIPCGLPPAATANFGWNPGPFSTTISYDNHCAMPKGVTVYHANADGNQWRCVVALGLGKGNEKVSYGVTGRLINVRPGCP